MDLVDDKHLPNSPNTIGADSEHDEKEEIVEEADDLEELRKKFVGEIDLPESTSLPSFAYCHVS
jgi:ribonucleoside-diphosphate reductase subunit M2